MPPNNPASPVPPSTPATTPLAPKKHRWLLYGCGGFLALLLLILASVVITVWWIQRPIKPVVLSVPEKAVVDAKLQHLSGGNAPPPARANVSPNAPVTAPAPNRGLETVELPSGIVPAAGANPTQDRLYTPGAKVFKLTDREINGLLNANTDLGQSVRLEFAQDAVNAYLAVPIPKDFPIGGGRMFRARGRFRVSLGNGGAPYAILEDVTVFGLSLPKAWLGGLKGENLLGQAVGEHNGSPILQGIKSLRIEPGALVLEVKD
jgi:hypothetical protein